MQERMPSLSLQSALQFEGDEFEMEEEWQKKSFSIGEFSDEIKNFERIP